MNKVKNLNYIIIFIIILLLFYYFYNLDKGFLLEENFFPWDSNYYFQMSLNFRDNLNIDIFKYPVNERILFPYLIAQISNKLNINMIYSALILNLISTFLTTYLIVFALNKFKISFFITIFIVIIFLSSFIMPLRFSIYYPGSNFAFDVFLVSTVSLITYYQIIKKDKFLFVLSIIFAIIGTLERGILFIMIYLIPLILFIFIYKFELKIKNLNNQIINFSIYTFISIVTLVSIKFFGYRGETGYSMLIEVISSIQFQANLFEFLYKYYYCFGVFFIIILSYIFLDFKNVKRRLKQTKTYKIENLFIISLFINSVIFSTIGGRGDVDRFLLWFLLPYLVLTGIILKKLLLNHKFKKVFFVIVIIGILGARPFVPAWPPLAFSDIFVEKNNVNTNFRDDLFIGPDYMKKFKNKMNSYIIGEDDVYKNIYNFQNKKLIQRIEIPDGQYFDYAKHRNYIHAYKYRINDIPFPLGYLHNQRNALIDHPYHGHRIIRFLYVFQWIILQFILIFYLKNFKLLKIFK